MHHGKLCTMHHQNKKVSAPNNNIVLDNSSSAKSFMYIEKSSGPSIKPCGAPALTLIHVETCPF